jgi:opacity protein-like surface antigen
MKTLKLTATALFLVASSALCAQDGEPIFSGFRPYLALGPTFAQGNARDLTQSSNGINSWTAEMGFEFYYSFAGMHLRPNMGMAKMYGVEKPDTWAYPTYKMMGWYGGFDIVYKNPRGWPINLTIGPSFHVWNVDAMTIVADRINNNDEQGLKLGWRGGVAYEINDMLNVELTYAMSEWRSRNSALGTQLSNPPMSSGYWAYQPGLNPSKPMYFSLKVFYKF